MQEKLLEPLSQNYKDDWYFVYFGLGIGVKLKKSKKIFQLSEAGKFLGKYLLKNITDKEKQGRILEIGTGSGALAILARAIGCRDVTATDFNEDFIDIARENSEQNERIEFQENNDSSRSAKIQFVVSDLFNSPFFSDKTEEAAKWDLIFFNPPGWQTPKDSKLVNQIKRKSGDIYFTMFEGDELVLRFLQQARQYLKLNGRILIGLNTIVGIDTILHKYRKWETNQNLSPLKFDLKEEKEIQLLLYNETWGEQRDLILSEIQQWVSGDQHLFTKRDGDIFWMYEIVQAKLIS